MIFQISNVEYNVFLALTMVLLATKAILGTYLGRKIVKKKRETGEFKADFVFAIFVFMIALFVSRIIYVIFDFHLTRFDPSTYWLFPNIIYWKLGVFISGIGFSYVIFVIDKKALQFKFKGIFAYFSVGMAILILAWPVNSSSDFAAVSFLGIIASSTGLIIPIIFIYLAAKIPGLRKPSLYLTFGFIIYALGASIINEFLLTILRELYGPQIHIVLYLVYLILKMGGLTMIAYGITNFSL